MFLVLGLTISNAATIECNHQTNSWTSYGSIDECIVYNLQFDEDDVVEGVKMISYGRVVPLLEMQSFYIRNSPNVQYVPNGLATGFPNIKILVIAYSGLKYLRQKDLMPFRQVTDLYLDNNELEYFEKDLFERNPNIKIINLERNKIKSVANGAFKPLIKLEGLNFSGNKCYSGKAEGLSSVKTLTEEIHENCKPADSSEENYETVTVKTNYEENDEIEEKDEIFVDPSSSCKLTSYASITILSIIVML